MILQENAYLEVYYGIFRDILGGASKSMIQL